MRKEVVTIKPEPTQDWIKMKLGTESIIFIENLPPNCINCRFAVLTSPVNPDPINTGFEVVIDQRRVCPVLDKNSRESYQYTTRDIAAYQYCYPKNSIQKRLVAYHHSWQLDNEQLTLFGIILAQEPTGWEVKLSLPDWVCVSEGIASSFLDQRQCFDSNNECPFKESLIEQ